VVDGYDVGQPIPISEGQATFSTSFEEAGRHTISAFYTGDSTYDESAAGSLEIRIRD